MKDKLNYLPFGKKNYQLMIIGAVILAIGFITMALDTEPYGFGTLGLWVGPIIILAGFVVEIFALLHTPKDK